MKITPEITEILDQRFGCDNLIALATLNGGAPAVRTVNAYYEAGSFYTVTWALSGKMQQIEKDPQVAICGEWFTGCGVGESLGHILLPENADLADKLRTAFAEWYGNGHVNEADPNTIILRLRLTEGVLFHQGTRYDIDFT